MNNAEARLAKTFDYCNTASEK